LFRHRPKEKEFRGEGKKNTPSVCWWIVGSRKGKVRTIDRAGKENSQKK